MSLQQLQLMHQRLYWKHQQVGSMTQQQLLQLGLQAAQASLQNQSRKLRKVCIVMPDCSPGQPHSQSGVFQKWLDGCAAPKM